MVNEYPDCSILASTKRFEEKFFRSVSMKGFAAAFPADVIEEISKAFQEVVYRISQYPECDEKKARMLEKDLSRTWVRRSFSLVLREPLNALTTQAAIDEKYKLCPNHFLNLSENTYEDGDETKSKIDGSLVHDDDEKLIIPGVPNWGFHRYSLEFKRGGTHNDPFNDKNPLHPESDADSRTTVRGQLFGYVDRVFKYQHRTGHFMLFVNGSEFRVMFWDRSGIVTTPAIEYAATPDDTKVLLRILYGLSQMNLQQAGLDPTATRLSEESCGWKQMDLLARENSMDVSEEEREEPDDGIPAAFFKAPPADAPLSTLFADGLLHDDPSHAGCEHGSEDRVVSRIPPTYTYIRELFKDAITGPSKARYALTVQGRYFLVGSAMYAASGPIGRGTRGFVALEWATQRIVFLKDSWRPHYVGVGVEGDTLRTLNTAGVVFTPTLICHEDIKDPTMLKLQETVVSRMQLPVLETQDAQSSRTVAPLPARARSGAAAAATIEFEPRTRLQKAKAVAGPSTFPQPQPRKSGKKRSHDEMQADRRKRPAERLRHLTHSRIVVAEVCMPSTAYTSSRQLVKIIYHSICGEF